MSVESGGDGGMNVKGYKEDKVCLCANPEECRGLTAAFVLLKDPRKGFVKLPNWKEDPPTQYYVERNQQRASYLRYLLPGHPAHERTPTKYIALHHFHPKVTQRFLDKRQKEIPKTITDMEMTHLGMELNDADRVLDEFGFPTGEYIFVPNYEVQKVKEDLKRMILINRLFHEAVNEAREEQEEHLKQVKEQEEAADREKLVSEGDKDQAAVVASAVRPDEREPTVLLLPSPLETYREPPEDDRRRTLHSQLEKWEHDRRSDYAVLLESNSATWRGSIDFLEDGVREIARAERLVLGAAMADKLFSEAMHAISHDSFLDDDGNAVTDIRRQNKLMGQREDEWMPTDMLHSVVEEKTRLGAKFGDNAEWGMTEIGRELTVFREEMEMEVAGIAKMGDSLLREMEASEKEVQTAWDALHAIVMSETMEAPPILSPTASHGSDENEEMEAKQEARDEDAEGSVDEEEGIEPMDGKSVPLVVDSNKEAGSPVAERPFQNDEHEDAVSPLSQVTPKQGRGLGLLKSLSELSRQSISPATASSIASAATAHFSPVRTSLRKISNVKDVWAREALYRVAAQHQAKVCHTCTGLLSKMSDAVKEIELERSVKLHAMLLDFLPRERRLFIGLPSVPKPVIDRLMTFRENESKMEEHIDEALHKRSRIVLRIDNDQRSSFLNRARCKAPDLTVQTDKPLEGEAFDTEKNFYASVIERRVASKMYKTTLAVVTADYYLHLFDAQEDSGISVDMSAEEAYQQMLPNHDFPSRENLGPRMDKVLKNLIPTETINLMNSSAKAIENGHVEVAETVPGRIREKATRKLVLKVEDDETSVWEDILQRRPKDETASDGLKVMLSV